MADRKGHKNKGHAILAQTKSSSGKKKERKLIVNLGGKCEFWMEKKAITLISFIIRKGLLTLLYDLITL